MSSPRSALMRRKVLVLGVVVGALAAPVSAIAQSGFDDVPPGHTHEAGIEYLVDTGITQGCDSDSYCPEDSLTRAQMATFLYRSSGNDPATSPSVNAATLDGFTVAELIDEIGPGPAGPRGPTGPKGAKGATGATGPPGPLNPIAHLEHIDPVVEGTPGSEGVFEDVPGEDTSLTVTVPTGHTAIIVATWSGESRCRGGATEGQWCTLRLVLDGVGEHTDEEDGDFSVDDNNISATSLPSAVTLVETFDEVGPGTYEVSMQWIVNGTPSFRLDDWTFVVEANLTS